MTLTGTAPLGVRTITVNGEQFFVTWSTLQNWSVQVSLFGYTNTLMLQGLDSFGHPVAGASAVIHVTDTSAPKDYSYIPYTQAGQVYSQSFNSLPNPGVATVNSDSPVTINGLVYSLANPFAFGAPIAPSGDGGLGLPFALAGWYGWAASETKLGASAGDQTTGGVISFGPTNSASANRALGLLATSSTGPTAFGAKLINLSGIPLNAMSFSYTGELWRQNEAAKTVAFGLLPRPQRDQHLLYQCHGLAEQPRPQLYDRRRRGPRRHRARQPSLTLPHRPTHRELGPRRGPVAGLADGRPFGQGAGAGDRQPGFFRLPTARAHGPTGDKRS